MIPLLVENPLLLLFLVAGIGYPLGQVRIGGVNLGIGAVLFVGLAVGSLHPDLRLPEVVVLLGLVLFVYTVGISSGPSFFESLRGQGLRDNALVAFFLLFSGALVWTVARVLGLSSPLAAGMFAGSLTNTPALAGVIDYLERAEGPRAAAGVLTEPTVAYSIAYPFGVLGVILAIQALRRVLGHVSTGSAPAARDTELEVSVVRVTRPEAAGKTVRQLFVQHGWRAVFGRVQRNHHHIVATDSLPLASGDLVSVVATRSETARVVRDLGEAVTERIDLDRTDVDYRRIMVSDRRVAGRTLKDLDLPGQYGAVVTRVRRGDVEFLPTGSTVVQLGDRLRVISSRGSLGEVSRFFGDSFKAVSEIDVLTFSLGILTGLLVGLLPLPMPGGVVFRLGLAGGPLLVALVLGKVGRTGPLVWALPYNANLTLRQLGLLMFLAGIGTRAGFSFRTYLATGQGLELLAGGAIVTAGTAFGMLLVGHLLFRIPFARLTGLVAGLHTQPAVLAFAIEQSEDEAPNVGYATAYPTATVLKVLIAQALAALL
jgi:putative transport protein